MTPRVLVADPNEEERHQVVAHLTKLGCEVVTVSDAPAAVRHLMDSPFQLIVSELNLPGWEQETDFWAYVRSAEKLSAIPFVLLTSANDDSDWDVAERMQEDVVLLKPLENLAEFTRVIGAKMGHIKRVDGLLNPETFVDILSRLSRGKGSGVLTAYRGEIIKRLYFREGMLAFAISNDPRELIGQAFLRSGLASEDELAWAFDLREEASAPLGQLLLTITGQSPDQMAEVARWKLLETVLEIFTWPDGAYIYFNGGIDPKEAPFWASVPLEPIIEEGRLRAAISTRVTQARLREGLRFEPTGEGPLVDAGASPGMRQLADLISKGYSLPEIDLELRGQQMIATALVLGWLTDGRVRPNSDRTAPDWSAVQGSDRLQSQLDVPDTDALLQMLEGLPPLDEDAMAPERQPEEVVNVIERGLILESTSSWWPAREAFVEALGLEPHNILARRKTRDIDDRLTGAAWGAGLYAERSVELAVEPADLDRHACTPTETFILRRVLEGPRQIGHLEILTPVPRAHLLRALGNLVTANLLSIQAPAPPVG